MKLSKICDENCNGNLAKIINNDCFRMAYFVLAKLYEKLGDKVYEIVEKTCPNLTCCPECHIDDFTHVEGCTIMKALERKDK